MNFTQYREQRLEWLRTQERTLGGGEIGAVNGAAGLIDMINEVKPGSLIEVGSCMGRSAEVFLLHCPRVVCVDSWDGDWASQFSSFKGNVGDYPNLEFFKGPSPQTLDRFRDGEFDACYIDGDHSYDPVKKDIIACLRIVKDGGWMCGHDYNGDVEKAVKELLGEPKVYIDTSWAIRKP